MSVNRGLRLTTMIAALVMMQPVIAHADNVSLNIKDSGGTDQFVVYDTGRVGIGTAVPNEFLDVNGNIRITGSLYKGYNTRISGGTPDIQIVREDNKSPRMMLRETRTSAAGGPQMILLHNNGTEASRQPALNGDVLGRVFFGSLNSYSNSVGAAAIFGLAAENFTDASTAGKLSFRTASSGTYTATERMVIDSAGNVGIGTSTPAAMLDVAGGILGRDINGNTVNLTSDARFKRNILPIDSALGKVLSLNGLSFEWKIGEYKDKGFPEGRHYGVIAQEIEKVLPEVVKERADGSKSVAYTEIIPVLIEAIKEQQKEIEQLKQRLSELQR